MNILYIIIYIEDYGMKMNISKTMAIGRKPKKIYMRIKDESVEQGGSLKHLGRNISSNMNCYQEVMQRIAMAKEAFNRKEAFSRFHGKITTEETSEVLCVVQRFGHYDGMSRNDWKHLRCEYGEGWSV